MRSKRRNESLRAGRSRWFWSRRIWFLAARVLRAAPYPLYWRASLMRTSETVHFRYSRGSFSYSFGPSPIQRLLRPLLTSRAGFHRRPFRHEARSPQVRTHSFPAQPPDLRRLILDHKSFAVSCPLALIGNAFYPVLVHRLAVSLHTSFPRSVTLPQLCFTSFAVVSLREDLHLQECAHAGRTRQNPSPAKLGGVVFIGSWR